MRNPGKTFAVAAGCTFACVALVLMLTPYIKRDDPPSCEQYSGIPGDFKLKPTAGMVPIPGGRFLPGSHHGYADERANQTVSVPSFWMDRTEVTNAQFQVFVNETGYVTDAEREGAAAVFQANGSLSNDQSWWRWTTGANWQLPFGPGARLKLKANLPVVHVTMADAMAYARWLGRDLPTEDEWEFAARGGLTPEAEVREPRDSKGAPSANYWQGIFPNVNTNEDGYADLAPVGCFPNNGYELRDMIGNVWELTKDAYSGSRQAHMNGVVPREGAATASAKDVVIKGGSFLCSSDYCMRYRTSARESHDPSMPTSHVGFRTVLRIPTQ